MGTYSKMAYSGEKAIKRNKYRRVIIAVCGVVLLLFGISSESTTVPEWKLRVVNNHGDPVSGVNVYQTWRYYTLESSSTFNRDMMVTDEAGYVIFPKRTVNASLSRHLLAFFERWIYINPHGSSGPHAHLSIHRGGNTYVADYKEGEKLPSQIIIEK